MFKELEIQINNLCGPSYIYFIFSSFILISSLINNIVKGNFNLFSLILRLLNIYIVTYILNWLCKKGYTNFSWFLLYWMFIFMIIIFISVFITINNALKNNDFVKLLKEQINK
jgi:hypothetical protein